MPAFNYFPATYQPYQQNLYQPQYPQIQQTQQMAQNGILWVSSEQEAFAYPVAPNSCVVLWHSSQPILYLKQADASGKPTLKIYDLQERTQNAPVSAGRNESSNDIVYALKSDTDAISREIEAIKSEVKNFKKEMSRNRKREVEDDDE